jgi:hypothetical protein
MQSGFRTVAQLCNTAFMSGVSEVRGNKEHKRYSSSKESFCCCWGKRDLGAGHQQTFLDSSFTHISRKKEE